MSDDILSHRAQTFAKATDKRPPGSQAHYPAYSRLPERSVEEDACIGQAVGRERPNPAGDPTFVDYVRGVWTALRHGHGVKAAISGQVIAGAEANAREYEKCMVSRPTVQKLGP